MMTMRIRIAIVALLAAFVVPAGLSGQAKLTRQQKDAADAAAAYERAMVFFQQGAYKEAEKEFRNAEKKTDDKNLDYVMATAYNYLKLHKPDDARKRYEKIYKNDPKNLRALVGLAASYEEMQNYREAVRMWQRYVKMDLAPEERDDAVVLLRSAQELFADRYEIAENPAGGSANLATPQEELEMGLAAAKEIAATGVPVVNDDGIVGYVQDLSQTLVAKSKNFPTNYELFVLDSRMVNAMAMPGFIFVFRGTLEAVESEAELAGVIAHEVGHAVAHHGAKRATKSVQDQKQAAELKASSNRFLRFLGRMAESGNPAGQLSFSRDQEAQADRLGVHIAFDAGYDPRALTEFFQKLESIEPSSRNAWDLMQRTHPFSIDRINAINEYASLLPDRSTTRTSPAFDRMKARLKTLPPAADATGQMKPALETAKTVPPRSDTGRPGGRSGGGVPFTLDAAPLSGEMPRGWTSRITEAGTTVFEGEKGTDAYEATVELAVAPKARLRGLTLDDMTDRVYQNLAGKPRAKVEEARPDRTPDGRTARRLVATYDVQNSRGRAVPVHLVAGVIEYPEWFVVISYFAPDPYFEQFTAEADFIANSLRYTGR